MQLEGNVAEFGAHRQSAQLDPRRRSRVLQGDRRDGRCRRHDPLVHGRLGLAGRSEHEFHDALLRTGAHLFDDAHGLTVTQHRGPIAESPDLQEAMGDEDDGLAGLSPSADDVEHSLGEVRGQGRGHLVEEQHVRVDGQRARQVEDAQDRERQVTDRGMAIQGWHAELADPAHEGLHGRQGEAQVGLHVQVRDQGGFLVDGDHAGLAGFCRRVHLARLAADDDAPRIRAYDAGQDLDEGGLAGAIGAEQAVDLARADGQRCIAQRPHRSIRLHDAAGLQDEAAVQLAAAAQSIPRRVSRTKVEGCGDGPRTPRSMASRVRATRPGPCSR